MRYLLHVALLSTMAIAPLAHGAELKWRVANSDRFSLYDGLEGECLEGAISSLESMPDVASQQSIEAWHLAMVGDGDNAMSPLGDPKCANEHISWDPKAQRYRRASVHRKSIRVHLWADRNGACTFEASDRRLEAPCRRGVVVPVPASGGHASLVGEPETATRIVPDEVVILGFGDSYASGEGNPDRPTQWDPSKDVASGDQRWLLKPERYQRPNGDPIWLDELCHRSFWSHQTVTAMHVAKTRPQSRVVFLHYACSGAEVLDGLLYPQAAPPGRHNSLNCEPSVTRGPHGRTFGRRPDEGCGVRSPQVVAAAEDLCSGSVSAGGASFVTKLPEYRAEHARRHGEAIHVPACSPTSKKPDLVLLSIGGNDTGFAQVAAWAVLPSYTKKRDKNFLYKAKNALFGYFVLSEARTCPEGFMDAGRCKDASAADLVAQLPGLLKTTSDVIASAFEVSPEVVVQTSYPDPVRKKKLPISSPLYGRCPGKGAAFYRLPKYYCGEPAGRTANPGNEWNTARLLRGHFGHKATKGWHFRVTYSEACVLQQTVVEPLRDAIRSAPTGFAVADGIRDAFVGRGFCAGTPNRHTRKHQPGVREAIVTKYVCSSPTSDSCDHVSRRQTLPDFQPHDWRAFAPMERLVRTTNDSYLTQSSGTHEGAMNGALHPTALGQAVMAEYVIPLAQDVLARSPSPSQAR